MKLHEQIIRALARNEAERAAGLVPCPAHDDKRASLRVSEGTKTPVVWFCHAGCTGAEVAAAFRASGLLTTTHRTVPDDSGKREWMRRVWRESDYLTEGDRAWQYLRWRGLDLSKLPQYVRMHRKRDWMVCGVARDGEDRLVGIHCTDLSDGFARKTRRMHGRVIGGAVRLSRHAGKLAIAEGIETALAYQQMTDLPTWAVLSAQGMTRFEVPPDVRELVLAVDFDGAGISAGESVERRMQKHGIRTRLDIPAQHRDDWMTELEYRNRLTR